MCGRPLRSKRNLREQCSPWSGADMCAAFDAAHTPQARMGVRGSGPIQGHALEALDGVDAPDGISVPEWGSNTGSGRWTRIEDSWVVEQRVGWCAMRRGGEPWRGLLII